MSPVTSRSDAEDLPADGRDGVRRCVVKAVAELLDRSGSNAATTRAVATAAGVQAPTIYRLFGDKDGLLEAVIEHGYAAFLAAKQRADRPRDTVEDLRAGWDLAVEFGLTHPALYALMYGEPRRGTTSAAY